MYFQSELYYNNDTLSSLEVLTFDSITSFNYFVNRVSEARIPI